MKKILSITLVLSIMVSVAAQEGSTVYNTLKKKYTVVVWMEGVKNEYLDSYAYYKVANRSDNGGRLRYGVCNPEGKEIIAPNYEDIILLGRWGQNDNGKQQTAKGFLRLKLGNYYGIADYTGKTIISPNKYSSIETRGLNGLFVTVNGDGGLVDTTGKVIIALIQNVKNINCFNGFYTVETKDGGKGLFDSKGKQIIKIGDYSSITPIPKQKIISVKKGDKYGLYDLNGKQLVDIVCPGGVIPYGDYYQCSYKVGDDYYYQIFNLHGKKVYEGPRAFVSEKVIAFEKDSLWGFMSVESGKVLVEPRFTGVDRFENGVARVFVGDTTFLITNPLKDGGKTISSLMAGHRSQSDIDRNVPQTDRLAENTFAVIIANESYSDFSVPFAINDGLTVKDYCNKTLGIPAANIIYLENATLNNILGTLNRIAEIAEVFDGEAQLLIYYSGMGLSDNAGNPYLMPVDATPSMLSSTAMSLSSLYEKLGSLNTDWILMLIDAGFTGENRDGKVPTSIAAKAQKNKSIAPRGNMVVISAASQGETALQYGEMQHGTFTYFLCKKLQQSKGNVSFAELAEYIISNTKTITQSRNSTLNNQHPEIISVDEKIKKQRL